MLHRTHWLVLPVTDCYPTRYDSELDDSELDEEDEQDVEGEFHRLS